MIPPRPDPVAELAEAVGKALLDFAERLRTAPEPMTALPADSGGAPDVAKLGGTQLRILTELEEAGESGLTARQVATQVGISPTNAPRTLRKLKERGLVTSSPDRPTLWRAAESAG